jgi:broad specificity phosphatase PhoE
MGKLLAGKLLIVRHGETEWNAEGRIQGHTDVALSERGIEQARMAARRLAHVQIDAAYSSDLRRSSQTARMILGERDAPLYTTSLLREYHKGVFEGLTAEETRKRYPELYAASLVKDLDFAPSGGETTRQTSRRIAGFVAGIKERHQGDTVLIVGHGGSLRAAFVALLELPLEANWKFELANCGLSMVDIYPDNAVLRLYNDTSHLDGLGPGL